jgi:hypothetical protein
MIRFLKTAGIFFLGMGLGFGLLSRLGWELPKASLLLCAALSLIAPLVLQAFTGAPPPREETKG